MKLSAARAILFFVSLALVNLGSAGRVAPAGMLAVYTVTFVLIGYVVLLASYFINGG